MADYPRLLIPALGRIYDAIGPIVEPLIRIAVGLSLMAHGYPKLFVSTAVEAAFFEEAGFYPPMFWTIAVGIVEFVGGALLAVGFLTRLAAAPIFIFLLVAILYHWQYGFYWTGTGWEYPMILALIVLHFLNRGAGPMSVDSALSKEF